MSLPYQQGTNSFNIGNIYPSAFFDYLSRLLPRKLKTLFKWLEYLYASSGQIFAVIKKFSEYPITSVIYDTSDEAVKNKLTEVMDKHIRIKATLIQVGIDYFVYGNSFVSVFRPFNRWLVCKKCKHKYNARNKPYVWNHTKFEFIIKCEQPGCHHEGVAEVVHEQSKNEKGLRIIRWDPKHIEINANPITGEVEYYYTIPDDIKQKIKAKKPDYFLLNSLPWEFIQTIKTKKIFKFSDQRIFHMKAPAPSGISQEWGFPGLLGAMKPFFYTAVLRKGNEAVALERMVPWRVLYPQPSSSSNDPGQFVQMQRWKSELQDAIKKWRKDPNMVKLSPIPVGMQNIGGDGRSLLTTQEIQQAEEVIISSMGVPKEFIYGGLSHAGGSVTLRMLENLLFTYTDQLVELAQWITDDVCNFMGISKVKVSFVDFKLVDDIQQKQLVGQLWERKEVSTTTYLKSLDIDPEKERKYMIEESIAKAKMDKEIQAKMRELENTLADKVEAQLTGNPLQYDPMAVMQVAQQEAQTLAQLPNDQRKARLAQIKAQDPVLGILATQALSELQRQQREQGAMLLQAPNGMSVTPEAMGGGSPSTPMAGR